MIKLRTQKGFTLIELMVVILIIAILGALGIVAYGQATKSARDGKRKSDMEAVKQALILYKQENSAYPSGGGANTFNEITGILTAANYLSEPAPRDPRNTSPYTYAGVSTGTEFCLCANMENDHGNTDANTCAAGSFVTDNSGDYYCAEEP